MSGVVFNLSPGKVKFWKNFLKNETVENLRQKFLNKVTLGDLQTKFFEKLLSIASLWCIILLHFAFYNI